MRALLVISFFLLIQVVYPQTSYPDSLLAAVQHAENDSVRYRINMQLSAYYFSLDRKKMFEYSGEAVKIARENNRMLDVASGLDNMGYYLNKEDRYGEAFQCYIEGIRLAEDPANELWTWSKPQNADPFQYRMQVLAGLHHDLGHVFWSTGNNMKAIQQFRKCLHYLDKALPTSYNTAYMNIGAVYLGMNVLDSALYYERKELNLSLGWRSSVLRYIGDIHFRKGNTDSAFLYYHRGIQAAADPSQFSQKIISEMGLAQWHLAERNKDSSLYYARRFLKGINQLQGNPIKGINISNAFELLYKAYRLQGSQDSTLKYLQLAFTARDSLSRQKIRNLMNYQSLSFEEKIRLEELENESLRARQKARINALLIGLGFVLVVTLILFRNFRQKHKANIALQHALTNLKTTQDQLVHAEKMASLGELTAGIAHEIQNPLNFVNNFSEVSNELIDEINEEIDSGDLEEIKVIAGDLKQNLKKITHHGHRASEIVKGMLQHSQSTTGEKELTDINKLADEYLHLAYHGLKAKDKSFNASFKTLLDPTLPKIQIIPQDIGRVILNLVNNAFYACTERSRSAVAEDMESVDPDYKPLVILSTHKHENNIQIRVKDNGLGIPDEIQQKIFQPFYTTKPTGEGTGLGLSLSYDIITKGYNGELKVNTQEARPDDPVGRGEGTEFIIEIPVDSN